MKYFLQKLCCSILSISVLTSSALPVFASESSSKDTIFIVEDETAYIEAREKTSGLKAKLTLDENIYLTEDEEYIYDTGTGVYQPVERIEVNLYDKSDLIDKLNQIYIMEEVKKDILEKSDIAILNENTDAQAIIFGQPKTETRTQSTTNYTYKNAKMQDQLVYYTNINTGYEYIKEGNQSNKIAKEISNLTVSIGGIVSKSLSVVGVVKSAYDAYVNLTGSAPISGHYDDYIQLKVTYDDYKKWTYCDIGSGWQFGSETHKVRLTKTSLIQYYFNYNGGNEVTTNKDYNETIISPNYNNPAPQAYQFIGSGRVELINGKIYNTTINF